MKKKVKRLHFFPNIITAFGLACGLFVILKVNMVPKEGGAFQVLSSSALLMLLAALADVLDGAVARIFRAESDFGTMFDSLSDAITFGVAPSVLLLSTLDLQSGSGLSFFALIGALLFSLCGVLRLVRFNVKAYAAKGMKRLSQPISNTSLVSRFLPLLLQLSRPISSSQAPLWKSGRPSPGWPKRSSCPSHDHPRLLYGEPLEVSERQDAPLPGDLLPTPRPHCSCRPLPPLRILYFFPLIFLLLLGDTSSSAGLFRSSASLQAKNRRRSPDLSRPAKTSSTSTATSKQRRRPHVFCKVIIAKC